MEIFFANFVTLTCSVPTQLRHRFSLLKKISDVASEIDIGLGAFRGVSQGKRPRFRPSTASTKERPVFRLCRSEEFPW